MFNAGHFNILVLYGLVIGNTFQKLFKGEWIISEGGRIKDILVIIHTVITVIYLVGT